MNKLAVSLLAALLFVAPRSVDAQQQGSNRPDTKPANPKKVVFLVSSSGSMLNVYRDLGRFVAKQIKSLEPTAQFNLLAYSDGKVKKLSAEPYVEAGEANKEKAIAFYGAQIPMGRSLPATGLAEAFRADPEAVYLFTNGMLSDEKDDWAALVERLNTSKTRVYIFRFGLDAPDRSTREAFEKIAARTGGAYRELGYRDLD